MLVTSVLTSLSFFQSVIRPLSPNMRSAPADEQYAGVRLAPAALGTIAVSVVVVLLFGVWPGPLLDLAGQSGATLTQTGLPIARP